MSHIITCYDRTNLTIKIKGCQYAKLVNRSLIKQGKSVLFITHHNFRTKLGTRQLKSGNLCYRNMIFFINIGSYNKIE